MPEQSEYRLGEYESTVVECDLLTGADLLRLQRYERNGRLAAERVPDGWRITAGAVAGVVVFEKVRVVVEPKLAVTGERLIAWLCYGMRIPAAEPDALRSWRTGPNGFADLVVAALVAECRALAAAGLRRGYVAYDAVEPVLRGRLDATAQLTRRYGMVDRLHARAHERGAVIWENRVCGTALAAASRCTRDPRLLRAVADTAAVFPRYDRPAAARGALSRARYTRLNHRYRSAHTWAALMLGGGGVRDLLDHDGWQAGTLLLDMPALWESVVQRASDGAARALGGAAVPSAGERALTVSGDLGARRSFRPDVLLDLGTGGGALPVDAKYKDYSRSAVASGDIHQLLTYSAAYNDEYYSTAVIVFPDPVGATRRDLTVAGGGTGPADLGTLTVLGIDTAEDPSQAEERIRAVLSDLLSRSAGRS